MPVSKKRLIANRKNCKKSTGPKTVEGKAASSRNATRHGLYAKDIVIDAPGLKEDPEEYENIVVALFNEFRPIGEFQEQLVFKIANCLWRSRRVIRAETAHLREMLKKSKPGDSGDKLNLRAIPDNYFSKLILRYEMRLDRQLSRYYRMLTHNQKMLMKM